jgi:ABC-type glycerol-3-phosphate transport system substrate-binding protein
MRSGITRRDAIKTAALATTALLPAPSIRGAHAAGKLSIGFWDHWVPGANNATKTLVEEWAAKEKVDVTIDYIPSQGMKNLITIAAESQARSGHDIFAFPSWQPHGHAENLAPVNDIMDELIKQNGAVNDTVTYLASWATMARGTGDGRLADQGTVLAHRPVQEARRHRSCRNSIRPARRRRPTGWTLDVFLRAAEACHKAGVPFGIGLGTTADSVDSAGAFFHAYGATLVDAKGNIHGQNRCGASGVGVLQEARLVHAVGYPGVGRCLQQQVARLRPRRALS